MKSKQFRCLILAQSERERERRTHTHTHLADILHIEDAAQKVLIFWKFDLCVAYFSAEDPKKSKIKPGTKIEKNYRGKTFARHLLDFPTSFLFLTHFSIALFSIALS